MIVQVVRRALDQDQDTQQHHWIVVVRHHIIHHRLSHQNRQHINRLRIKVHHRLRITVAFCPVHGVVR